MRQTNRGADKQKIVLRIKIHKPDFAAIGKALFFAPKNAIVRLLNARLRYRMLAAVVVLILAEIYGVLSPYFNDNAYALGNGAALLPESSQTMADKVSFNRSNQTYNFNTDQTKDAGAAGQKSLASATLNKDASKGVSINDPTNKVNFTMTPLYKLKEGKQDKDRIVYPLMDGSGWAVYTLQGIGVKEDIILNYSHADTASYKYRLQLGDGMVAHVEQNGSVGIYGNTLLSGDVSTGTEKDAELLKKAREKASKDTLLFGIPAPVVNDKYGPADGISARYSLVGDELAVDVKGLKKGKYPVTIDPSVYVVTAQQFMAGNNETNINFDVDNKLIKKGRTTGARFDQWTTTSSLPAASWGSAAAGAGGYLYSVGGASFSGQVYTSQGASTYVVPAGVTSITVKMWGGAGGGGAGGSGASSAGGAGGGGGYVTATHTVTPSETLNVYVGGGGAGGTKAAGSVSGAGGAGGGYSSLYRSATPLSLAAGGAGGGGGNTGATTPGGAGGAGGTTTGIAGTSAGGAGAGGAGTPSAGGTGGTVTGGNPGTDGTSLTGGAGADGRTAAGTDGSGAASGLASGGRGGSVAVAGRSGAGGGSAGYFGGGGGAGAVGTTSGAGGGGSGSSYTTTGSTTAGSGTAPGNSGDINRNGAADGGAGQPAPGAAAGSGTTGDNGLVFISYGTGYTTASQSVNWAKFNTGTGTLDNADPGTGACSGWCTTAAYNLPTARANLSMVAYNGFLYAFGGTDTSGTRQNTVYIAKIGANGEPQLWHPTDTNPNNWNYWYQDTNLSSIRAYSGAVAYNNRMYLVGGVGATVPVSTVEVANINPTGKLGTWTTTTALGSAVYGHSVQVYNDRLYVLGGASTVGGAPTNTTYYNKINSDGTLNAWQQTTSFTAGRMSMGGSFSVIWGAYIYISGGCSVVNGSGNCTTIQSDAQVVSINADGSLDTWNNMAGVTDARIGYNLIAWRDNIYEIGGCTAQDATTGDCDTGMISAIKYGKINQDGDASTVGQSVASGSGTCTGGAPTGCNLPGTTYIGNMLTAAIITNGYLYLMGGCTDNLCSATSNDVAYVAISSTGQMTKPATCPGGTYQGTAWCTNSNTLPSSVAASSTVTFGGRIYLVGGLNGVANTDDIMRATVNSDGSLSAWTLQDLSGAGSVGASDVSYSYAYARANPSGAGSNAPGNLFIFGGCTASSDAGCTTYTENVYKCTIQTDGVIASCSTSGQLLIGTITGATGTGLGLMSGTVYANYVYLIGGVGPNVVDLNTVRYAKIDNNNNVVTVGSGWVQSSSVMNTGRRRAAAFGYNGYLYVVGGYEAGAGVLPDIEFIKINVSDGTLVGDPANSNKFYTSGVAINQRWGLTVPVSNSYAYVIGGCTVGASPSSCTTRTDVIQTFQLYNNDSGAPASFSTSANTYSTNPDRLGISSTVLNGYVYVAGGCISTSNYCVDTTNTVSYAQIDANGSVGSWSDTSASLPADRAWGELRAAGGSLYYMGGQSDTPSDYRTEVYYGTPSSGNVSSWGTASNGLPNARTNFGGTVWNDRLYVVGGQGSGTGCASDACSTVYVSPQQNSGGNITSAWSTASTSFNVARSGTVAVAYANNLYVLGGYDGTNYLSDTQYSQLSTANGNAGSWLYSESMPQPLAQGDGFAANGYIYVAGGRSATETCDPTTFVAPVSANTTIASGNNPTGIGTWYEANARYSGNRFGNGVAYHDGKAYVIGGANCAVTGGTFTTAGTSNYVVPSGVTSIIVKMWGAGGGGGGGGFVTSPKNGGGGGYVTSTLTVTPGETLSVTVGGAGGGGGNNGGGAGQGGGGGGGGYSRVYRSTTPLLIAAGGGGGGGDNSATSTVHGGPGGGTSGLAGSATSPVTAAGGGTSSGGGGGGGGGYCGGAAGSSLTGGSGGTAGCGTGGSGAGGSSGGGTGGAQYNFFGTTLGGGGGGGGGYFGGGGGSTGNSQGVAGGGGGGGSSYTTGSSVTNTAGSNTPTLGAPGNAADADRGTAGNGGAGAAANGTNGTAGNVGKVVINLGINYATPVTQQTTLLSQPQVAKYSIMIDADSDVFPTHWLLNGLDNSIGAKWQLKYRSMTNPGAAIQCAASGAMTTWGTDTNFGNVTLGLPGIYTPRDGGNVDTNCARYYYFNVSVDSSQAFGYPDDVTRGPTITDLTMHFVSDPAKRLMHGRTFTGGLQMPIDTPYYAN